MKKESLEQSLHLGMVVYEYLKHFESPAALLDDYHSMTGWCEALIPYLGKVSVIIRFRTDAKLERNGVVYHFVSDCYGPCLRFWQIPNRLHRYVDTIQPDVLHSHNMNRVLQHLALLRTTKNAYPLVLQNHAEWPQNLWRKYLQRLLFKQVTALLFCARGQEQTWVDAGIVRRPEQVHYVMEGSTHFELMNRRHAREQTSMSGYPVLLWVGNLNANKDPLTILAAFEELLPTQPQAHMYMIYRFEELLPEVKARIATSDRLREAVTLLGAKPRAELIYYYNSADYFLLGSTREGSGYSLMEAMACGCIPIVTDIPSFRMMTQDGRLGALWPVGDTAALVAAMQRVVALPLEATKMAVRHGFEEQLSYSAIAKAMIGVYGNAWQRR